MSPGVGIDVSKKMLDVHVHGQARSRQFANGASGWKALIRMLSAIPVHQVVLEATGGYEQAVLDVLHAAGLPVVRINPRQARDFAKATGQLAKTDALDARVLAHAASVLELIRYQPAEPWQRQLAEYHKRRAHVLLMLQQERSRSKQLSDPWLKRQAQSAQQRLIKMRKQLDQRISQLLAKQPQLKVLLKAKGVGQVTLSALASQLPELGRLTGKAASKLAGVAPLARDSGQSRGARSIWGGRAQVRTALYMATLSAIRYEPALRAFYQQLRARGKPGKVAIVAAMRKLLVILNARMRDQYRATATA